MSSAGAPLQALLSWFSFGVRFLLLIAVIGVALGPIRRAHANAALALAGAAAIDLAVTVFWRLGILLVQSGTGVGSFDAVFTVLDLVSIAAHMATGALLTAAMVLLAGAARGR